MNKQILLITAASALMRVSAIAQVPETPSTFFHKKDLLLAGVALGGTAVIAMFDEDIAQASQRTRFQSQRLHDYSLKVSKVNETTLTLAGVLTYGIGRVTGNRMVSDVALHATESVVLASAASQLIRGPLGRTRPYVTHDSNAFHFKPFRGFFGDSSFDYRAFPSIHTSSSMAVATVLVMETHRRKPGATPFVAPLIYAAGLLPGIVRIQLDQHWASDIAAGAFMGVLAGYKVVTYSHDHPNNRVDRILLKASVSPSPSGGWLVGLSL